jgi:rhodanese-related sulfurtransferase
MGKFVHIAFRAALITLLAALTGLLANSLRSKPFPWMYEPPTEKALEGAGDRAKVPVLTLEQARDFFEDGETVFVDARDYDDFEAGRVRGAVHLPAGDPETAFEAARAQAPEDFRVIIYCSSPECDMAEKIAKFLHGKGYKDLSILGPGLSGWKKAGYPTEKTE